MTATVQRTVRVPLERPDDETWKALRDYAAKAAVFANRAIVDLCQAGWNGLTGDDLRAVHRTSYGRMNDELSGWVRSAMTQNRIRPYWKRSGRLVLAGKERAAGFSADRALTISADQRNNCGATYERDGDDYVLTCRFAPVGIRDADGKRTGRREPIRLTVGLTTGSARRDASLQEAIAAIWSGAWSPGVLTLRFDVRRRTVDALISYSRPRATDEGDGTGATLGPYNPETNELWLRFDRDGVQAVNYAKRIYHMLNQKESHEGKIRRFQRQMRRGGKGARRLLGKKLRETGDFSVWAHGRMHELSREITARLKAEGVSELRIAPLGEGDLPWHTLKQQLTYKCEAAGIRIALPDVKQDATAKAEKARIAKTTRKLHRARRGLADMNDLLSA